MDKNTYSQKLTNIFYISNTWVKKNSKALVHFFSPLPLVIIGYLEVRKWVDSKNNSQHNAIFYTKGREFQPKHNFSSILIQIRSKNFSDKILKMMKISKDKIQF